MTTHPLRQLPSVNDLLQSPVLSPLVERLSHNVVVRGARELLEEVRQQYQQVRDGAGMPSVGELAERISRRLLEGDRPRLVPVINATGILLHTGLGRAPLAETALEAVAEVGRGYSSVELDLATGQRSNRNLLVRHLLCELTGAESAVVVNNNAGATVLVLAALAQGRDVIVSRGQLIEIGGSFRLPEIMAVSGARMVEVGTTNKTRLTDYEAAIAESTAALLRVHTSNFRVVGFTAEVPLEDLVDLGRRRGLKVIDDIGSGALVDFAQYGFADEPVARRSVEAGAGVVLFSGDKLLGGPQAGLIVGREDSIRRIERHPFMRALRVDKLTLAALEATLRLYRNPERAAAAVPLLMLLSTPPEKLKQRARRLAKRLGELPAITTAEVVEDVCYLGGGSIPTQQLPTCCTAVVPEDGALDDMAGRLRLGSPAVVARVQGGQLLFDLRTVFPHQDAQIAEACRAALQT
jgi:L-seryl-tRNA(Ser) seleniumtransferase